MVWENCDQILQRVIYGGELFLQIVYYNGKGYKVGESDGRKR